MTEMNIQVLADSPSRSSRARLFGVRMPLGLWPVVILSSVGCSFFQSPESRMVGYGEDCVDRYEGWTQAIKDAEDEDETRAILDEIVESGLSDAPGIAAAMVDLSKKVNGMDGGEREDFHKEWLDPFVDVGEDCHKAKEEFREELRDNEDACEAFFEWREDKEDSYEDWDEAREEYQEDCDDDCVSIFFEKPYEDVPFPEDLGPRNDADDCED